MRNHPNRSKRSTVEVPEARVYCAGGIHNDGKWYYRIGQDTPVGPFEAALDAGKAARAAIIELADKMPSE